MADMNVNLQGNMDRVASILRDGNVDKAELSEDIDALFEAKQDGGDDPVDANDYMVALASHADSISPEQVDDYTEIMREFASMDGDGTTFSQTEITLMKQLLAGEDTTDTEAALKELSDKQAEIDRLEEENKKLEEEKATETTTEETKAETKEEKKGISDAEALSYAKDLYEAAQGRAGTDEDAVEEILYDSNLSSEDIVKIMDAYESKYGKSLEKAIKADFSGKAEDRLLDVLHDAEKEAAKNKEGSELSDREVQKYAKDLYEATAGAFMHTDEDVVNSILLDGGLSSADIQRIKAEYKDQYGTTLEKHIKADFSGDAEDELLAVLEDEE